MICANFAWLRFRMKRPSNSASGSACGSRSFFRNLVVVVLYRVVYAAMSFSCLSRNSRMMSTMSECPPSAVQQKFTSCCILNEFFSFVQLRILPNSVKLLPSWVRRKTNCSPPSIPLDLVLASSAVKWVRTRLSLVYRKQNNSDQKFMSEAKSIV